MTGSGNKDIDRTRVGLSRRTFLKIAGAASVVLGTGGLSILGGLLGKHGAATAQEPMANDQSFSYIVYTRGSETVAQKYIGGSYPGGGTNPIHSTSAEEVIKNVLADGGPVDDPNGVRAGPGHIYIRDGLYRFNNSFSGFDLRSYTVLTLGPQAIIRVPSGYSGYVFRLQSKKDASSLSNCIIKGGIIHEAHPAQRKWTGISLHAINGGVYFNKFIDLNILDAGIGIELRGTTTSELLSTDPNFKNGGGWVNGNLFESITMMRNSVFIDFVLDGSLESDPANSGINRNRFINIECQSGLNTIYGIRNIRDYGNSFIAVNIWDIELASRSAIISDVSEQATGTMILSGFMTGQNFENRGTDTKIIDELNSTIESD